MELSGGDNCALYAEKRAMSESASEAYENFRVVEEQMEVK